MTNLGGWYGTTIMMPDGSTEHHVHPINDLKDHDIEHGDQCWCKPTHDEDFPSVIIHNSLDGREQIEGGERTAS